MSDRRSDNEEPTSIEDDVAEADWIEQHQPVDGEPDDDLFPSAIPEDVSEADALDQARSVSDDEPDVDVELPVEPPTEFAEEASDDEPDEIRSSPEGDRARGCNLVAVVADVLMRSAGDAIAWMASRTSTRPPR